MDTKIKKTRDRKGKQCMKNEYGNKLTYLVEPSGQNKEVRKA